MGNFWTPERVETLRVRWRQDFPVIKIAELLGATKNQVIGKARRLDLPMHIASLYHPDRPRKPRPKQARKPQNGHFVPVKIKVVREVPKAAPDALNVAFADLEHQHCRYPTTEDHPFLFCGAVKSGDSSYCEYHHDLCHEAPRPRKESSSWRDRRAA